MCQNFDLTHKPPLTHCLGSLAGIIFFVVFKLPFCWAILSVLFVVLSHPDLQDSSLAPGLFITRLSSNDRNAKCCTKARVEKISEKAGHYVTIYEQLNEPSLYVFVNFLLLDLS